MSRYRQTMAESLIQVWEGTKAGFGGAMTGDKGKAFQPRQLKDPKKENPAMEICDRNERAPRRDTRTMPAGHRAPLGHCL